MDLWVRGHHDHANRVLNRYLWHTADWQGLPLLTLFLSCRAAIRAKTSIWAAAVQDDAGRARELRTEAAAYLDLARAALERPACSLLALGGLSGTGKTTLSTDRERLLIGDDEHGWTQQGIFNIEGGCYAKVIRLREEAEPDIFEMTHEFGTILENVVFDEDTREPDLDDDTVTENTRGSYPLTSLGNVWDGEVAPHPSHVILLTADAFGVMPPVARLSTAQALYHFLSGYTSKLAGTEVGLTEPEATFSSCYGAPFMALNPTVYADLLAERLDATGAEVWLINTGWVGGGYGIGERIAIKETRKMVRAVLNGTLDGVEMRHDPVFGFDVPTSCPGVDSHLLNPREMWPDKAAYDEVYTNLADKFSKNFEQFRPLVTQAVTEAGP
ncbi:MAG: phosphoenolpyruvate carboxykinase (ATP) [Dehalococcoidia bacterium]|nr:phosphoenolpyruvate carboxykinase (ATP) [Dehalococcoidia bacterium]